MELERVVELKPDQKIIGHALMSYRIRSFVKERYDNISYKRHSTAYETEKIASLLLEYGYQTDIIDYNNKKFRPKKKYSIVIDVLSNLERLAPELPENCIKIFHPCWCHWAFHNHAIFKRLNELRTRKGIVLKPTNLTIPNLSAEIADYITQRGEMCSAETYQHTMRPTLPVRHSSVYEYDWALKKDYEDSRNKFLWLGGYGLVSKGLDLVLDVFSKFPDYQLYVCGPIFKEPDFEAAFHKELYQTPNIHTLGFIDVGAEAFKNLAQKCIALIYPSCTELSSGSVITSMHAGLIPVISKQSGVNVGNFGYILNTCSTQDIKNSISTIAATPLKNLIEKSRAAYHYARINHTKLAFENDFKDALKTILKTI